MGIVKGLVNPNVVNAFTAMNLSYARALDSSPMVWCDLIVEELPASPTLADDFYVDLSTGGFREWTGERQMRDVLQDKFTTSKRHFEDSMRLPKLLAINGTYQSIAAQEGARFAGNFSTFKNRLAKETLRKGASTRCWDGDYFFGTAHPVDVRDSSKGTFRNKIVAADNIDLDSDGWADVKAEAESVLAPNGEPYGATVSGLIYTPAAEPKVKALFGKEFLSGGESNEYASDIDVGSRRKAVDLADVPKKIFLVLSAPGKAKPLPMAQTELFSYTMGEESDYCAEHGYVAELADFYASIGMANPRLIWEWELP